MQRGFKGWHCFLHHGNEMTLKFLKNISIIILDFLTPTNNFLSWRIPCSWNFCCQLSVSKSDASCFGKQRERRRGKKIFLFFRIISLQIKVVWLQNLALGHGVLQSWPSLLVVSCLSSLFFLCHASFKINKLIKRLICGSRPTSQWLRRSLWAEGEWSRMLMNRSSGPRN